MLVANGESGVSEFSRVLLKPWRRRTALLHVDFAFVPFRKSPGRLPSIQLSIAVSPLLIREACLADPARRPRRPTYAGKESAGQPDGGPGLLHRLHEPLHRARFSGERRLPLPMDPARRLRRLQGVRPQRTVLALWRLWLLHERGNGRGRRWCEGVEGLRSQILGLANGHAGTTCIPESLKFIAFLRNDGLELLPCSCSRPNPDRRC